MIPASFVQGSGAATKKPPSNVMERVGKDQGGVLPSSVTAEKKLKNINTPFKVLKPKGSSANALFQNKLI